MDSLIDDLEQLKISALLKLQAINSRYAEKAVPSPEKSKNEANKPCKKQTEETKRRLPESKSENEIEKAIKILETQRQKQVKSRIQARIDQFENFTRQQELNTQRQWLEIQQISQEDNRQKENAILQAMLEYDKNSSDSRAKLDQYYHKLQLQRQMREEELKTRERQKQIMHDCIDKIKKHQQDFNLAYQQIIPILKKCSNNDELKIKLAEEFKELRALPGNFERIITKCRTHGVSEEDERQAGQTLAQLKSLGERMGEIVEQVLQKNKEVEISKVPAVPEPPQATPPVPTPVPVTNEPPKTKTSVSSITRYVSLTNLKMYTDIIDFFDKHTESFKSLQEDVSLKQFKFDCKKAINIPVNSLSDVNSEHILDKYNRLRALLSGQDVVVSNSRINASKHPQGIAFCMDLLAKKFVLQGDLMVSSNPDSAFCYASVMSSLWNDFPIFGQLLLANFYKSCPYLVPYCIPRQVGESDEEFYTRQGYQYNDGQIEKQDKFLKRMTGIMRLYAAMMIVKPKKGQKSIPHNISHGWRWISSVLKLEPQVDITATMLHTFLETAGFEMEARYGRAFQKIIAILVHKFMPSCREKCTGGATTRLESLLTDYFKNRKFNKPNRYFDYNFW